MLLNICKHHHTETLNIYYICVNVHHLGLFMLYLYDLFLIFVFIFIMINHIISLIQTHLVFCLILDENLDEERE